MTLNELWHYVSSTWHSWQTSFSSCPYSLAVVAVLVAYILSTHLFRTRVTKTQMSEEFKQLVNLCAQMQQSIRSSHELSFNRLYETHMETVNKIATLHVQSLRSVHDVVNTLMTDEE